MLNPISSPLKKSKLTWMQTAIILRQRSKALFREFNYSFSVDSTLQYIQMVIPRMYIIIGQPRIIAHNDSTNLRSFVPGGVSERK